MGMPFEVVLVLCLLPPVVWTTSLALPKNCDEVYKFNNGASSGIYTIYPTAGNSQYPGADTAVQVYCDMDTDGRKWTVFQRRMDGTVLFTRRWDEYKRGFGNVDGEYWLGLENLYYLTYEESELRVDMEDFSRKTAFSYYDTFYIDSEDHGYMMHVSRLTDGIDSLDLHNGERFSTIDREYSPGYAKERLGGFWYTLRNGASNPNGVYLWGECGESPFAVGVFVHRFRGVSYSLKSISMKVRPKF